VPKLGAITTSIVTVAVAFLSASDTACKETVRVAEMPLGAVYRTLLDVEFVSVPQPAPEQLVPVNCHITPWFEVSFARVAMNVSDCPVSIIWVVPGMIWTVILLLDPPPPHPAVNAVTMHANARNPGPKRSFVEFPVVRAYVFEVVISPFRMTFLVRPRWDERTPRQTRGISETS
jgi:hypothetical protein